MTRSSDWPDYAARLARLSRVASLSPSVRQREILTSLEDALIDRTEVLEHSGQRATALEVAVEAGSERLVDALPPVDEARIADLDRRAWLRAAARLSPEALHTAVDKGLELDWHAMHALICAGRQDILELATGPLSEAHFWFPELRKFPDRWLGLTDPPAAAEFLTAQVRHHPKRAARTWREAMMCGAHSQAIAWQAAGAAIGPDDLEHFGDPEEKIVNQAQSHHEAIAIRQRCRSLVAHHAHYSLDPRALDYRNP